MRYFLSSPLTNRSKPSQHLSSRCPSMFTKLTDSKRIGSFPERDSVFPFACCVYAGPCTYSTTQSKQAITIPTLESAAGIPSSLTTIALGASKYRDGTNVNRDSAADDDLMLRTYSIEHCQNAMGKYAPLLRLRAEGHISHMKPFCSDVNILELYWLDRRTRFPDFGMR